MRKLGMRKAAGENAKKFQEAGRLLSRFAKRANDVFELAVRVNHLLAETRFKDIPSIDSRLPGWAEYFVGLLLQEEGGARKAKAALDRLLEPYTVSPELLELAEGAPQQVLVGEEWLDFTEEKGRSFVSLTVAQLNQLRGNTLMRGSAPPYDKMPVPVNVLLPQGWGDKYALVFPCTDLKQVRKSLLRLFEDRVKEHGTVALGISDRASEGRWARLDREKREEILEVDHPLGLTDPRTGRTYRFYAAYASLSYLGERKGNDVPSDQCRLSLFGTRQTAENSLRICRESCA